MAQGKTSQTIADELYLREQDVKSHIAKICRKIGAKARIAIALWVISGRRERRQLERLRISFLVAVQKTRMHHTSDLTKNLVTWLAFSYAAVSSTIRATVLLDRPISAAISPSDLPASRSSATLTRSVTTRGRPPTRPCFRARSRPATVRSLSRMRSCLAMVARMDSTASRKMPQESRYCSVNDFQPTP